MEYQARRSNPEENMKLSSLFIGAILIMSVGLAPYSYVAGYTGGSGTPADPYQISTVADWQELMTTTTDGANSFILTADLDMTGVILTPVGPPGVNFTGVFDGQGHILRNVVINQPQSSYVGLFGLIIYGQVKNLGLDNVSITGVETVGGLVGYNIGTITDCYAIGTVVSRNNGGGLCGYNGGSVSHCYATGTVNGGESLGGLCGMTAGTISNCYATSTVTGYSYYVGGLAGGNGGTVTSSYSMGSVSGFGEVGGLIGSNWGPVTACDSSVAVNGLYSVGGLVGLTQETITSCSSTGPVNGRSPAGGLVGYNRRGTINSCYASGSVDSDMDGATSGIGGLCGMNYLGVISESFATGTVSGNTSVGGLCGSSEEGTISNSYAANAVIGKGSSDALGGLIGSMKLSEITNCYAASTVTGSGSSINFGGLDGTNQNSVIRNCFWDSDISGQGMGKDGVGLPTFRMQKPDTYLHVYWDFKGEIDNGRNDFWLMPAGGGYPILAWQVNSAILPNDEMAGAISIGAGASISGTTVGATGLDLTVNGYNDCLDIWYLFVPDEEGQYSISVQGSFDTTLGVFDSVEREVAFNDDFFGGKSEVILKASAGQHYFLRIAGYDGQMGDFTLTIEKGAIQMIQGDLNYDGKVDLVDLSLMAQHWLMGV
jgi:hypothetical protein